MNFRSAAKLRGNLYRVMPMGETVTGNECLSFCMTFFG